MFINKLLNIHLSTYYYTLVVNFASQQRLVRADDRRSTASDWGLFVFESIMNQSDWTLWGTNHNTSRSFNIGHVQMTESDKHLVQLG